MNTPNNQANKLLRVDVAFDTTIAFSPESSLSLVPSPIRRESSRTAAAKTKAFDFECWSNHHRSSLMKTTPETYSTGKPIPTTTMDSSSRTIWDDGQHCNIHKDDRHNDNYARFGLANEDDRDDHRGRCEFVNTRLGAPVSPDVRFRKSRRKQHHRSDNIDFTDVLPMLEVSIEDAVVFY